jgi:hypothetical protein
MTAKISVALVGLGFGAEFVPIYRDHPDVGALAICDADPTVLATVGDEFGIAERYASLDEVLAQTDLWDGRASVLQVTEATGGLVRVRILVTAQDAPTLFDLRCVVREAMVTWVQSTMPAALPVQRVMMTQPEPNPSAEPHQTPGEGLFTGSAEAEARASTFTQAIPVISPADAAAAASDQSSKSTATRSETTDRT